MANKQDEQFKKNLDLFLRRKKIIYSCLIISIFIGLGLYLRTAKTFQTTAMIKYQRQSINPTAMSPDVETRINDIVSTLSQQITSRTSLEELITQFNLYKELLDKQPMEDVVELMREKAIKIEPAATGEIFTVSFQGNDPQKVMQVTNALASKFVEENIRFREERVTENSSYIKEELRMAKEALDKKDSIMRDYKLKYYNEMPQQLQNNMSRLNSLQTQYQDNQSNIQHLEQTKLLIQEQITTLRTGMLPSNRQGETDSLDGQNMVYQTQNPTADLSQLKQELQVLRSRYTDQHPEVKRLANLIQQREELLKNMPSQHGELSEGTTLSSNNDEQLDQLLRQLKETEYGIVNLKKEKEAIQLQINKYTNWVEATPLREAEWTSLTRDYDQLNQHYDNLVAQSLAAESAESLERSQKGSQFKIIDSAHFPEKPIKPDFTKIMLIALALGLACGAGISYSVETLDTSFKDPSDIESSLGIAVACSIPIIYTDKEQQRKKIQSIMWALTFIIPTIALVVGIVYLAQKGLIII
jgi:succinoglycan biosynthesis transport protein ExoP